MPESHTRLHTAAVDAAIDSRRSVRAFLGAGGIDRQSIDRTLRQGSWLDYGMFLPSIMVAARGPELKPFCLAPRGPRPTHRCAKSVPVAAQGVLLGVPI